MSSTNNSSKRKGNEGLSRSLYKKRRTGVKQWQCPQCKLSFACRSKLDMIESHMENQEECRKVVFYCPAINCNKKFLDETSLNSHMSRARQCSDEIGQNGATPHYKQSSVQNQLAFRPKKYLAEINNPTVLLCKEIKVDPMMISNSQKGRHGSEVVHNSTLDSISMMYQCNDLNIASFSSKKKLTKTSRNNKHKEAKKTNAQREGIQLQMNVSTAPNYIRDITNGDNEYEEDDNVSLSPNQSLAEDDDFDCEGNWDDNSSPCNNNDTTSRGNDRYQSLSMESEARKTQEQTEAPHSIPSEEMIDMKKIQDREKEFLSVDVDFERGISLLNLLISKKISLHRYRDFMAWRFGEQYKFPSFERIIKSAASRVYGASIAEKMAPQISLCELPSGRYAPLVTFDVTSMVYDLLSDVKLTNNNNTIFTNIRGNPFVVPESDVFNDFDSSTYYTKTMEDLDLDPSNHVLCPIVLYIDEIKLDTYGKLGLEPVVLSLMIYNRETRNQAKAWRTIGYMPNFTTLFGQKSYSSDEKSKDYHFCMNKILEGIKTLQKDKKSFRWKFEFFSEEGDRCYERNLFFPLAYIIGDAKGNDILCGRYGSHHNTECVARDCDAKTKNCDNPDIRCNFLKMSNLLCMGKKDLEQLSFKKLPLNAFEDIWFGSQPYGINGCVPAEPLHQINMGIVERLAETFFARLSKSSIDAIDTQASYICTQCYRQSDRDYPDLFPFTSGVSKAKKLTAREKLSRLFCIYLTLLTNVISLKIIGSEGRIHKNDVGNDDVSTVIDEEEYNNWVDVFEQTLLLTSWVYLTEHPKIFLKGGRNSVIAERIKQFVKTYKHAAPRKTGMGLKLVKFHQLLHLWWIIKLYGSLLNVDGARGESNAIVLTKEPGLKTQMRHVILNLQTSTERYKRDVIMKAYEMTILPRKMQIAKDIPEMFSNNSVDEPCGSRYILTFNYQNHCIVAKWKSHKMKSKSCNFPQWICDSVFHKFAFYNAGNTRQRIKSVEGFTEYNVPHQRSSETNNDNGSFLVRACPKFRSSRPWHDWALIKWNIENVDMYIEGQVLMMLDLSTIKFEERPTMQSNLLSYQTEHSIIESRLIAIVHSATEERIKTSYSNRESSIATWLKMEDTYQMVDISCIHKACFVIVNSVINTNHCNTTTGNTKEVISIIDKKDWSNIFLNYNDDRLREEAQGREDNQVSDQDLMPFET